MEIAHREKGNEGMFYIEEAGDTVAEMTYIRKGNDRMIIDHTRVDETLEGTGAAKQLLETAINFAKENSLKIVPLCPYVKHQFEKYPEKYADIIAA